MSELFPHASKLSAYMHEDWDVVHGSFEKALEAFVWGGPRSRMIPAAEDFERFADWDIPDEDLSFAVHPCLGVNMHVPPAEVREWARHAARLIRKFESERTTERYLDEPRNQKPHKLIAPGTGVWLLLPADGVNVPAGSSGYVERVASEQPETYEVVFKTGRRGKGRTRAVVPARVLAVDRTGIVDPRELGWR